MNICSCTVCVLRSKVAEQQRLIDSLVEELRVARATRAVPLASSDASRLNELEKRLAAVEARPAWVTHVPGYTQPFPNVILTTPGDVPPALKITCTTGPL